MGREHGVADTKARTTDRRTGNRRVSISASVENRRDKGDRRSPEDRRGNFFNLYNPRDDFLYEAFAWLIDTAQGEWTSGPNENEPDESLVTCRIRFEEKSDLEAFIEWLNKWETEHP